MILGAANYSTDVVHYMPDPQSYLLAPNPNLVMTNVFTKCDSSMCATEKIQIAGTPLSTITFTN
jgi:hypothetical protein